MIKYKLNEWAVVNSGNRYCLIGKVEGHPDREDGHTVVSSYCIGKYEGRIVTTSGSHIELGEPKADYEAMFPNAKQRLFDTAPQLIFCGDGLVRGIVREDVH